MASWRSSLLLVLLLLAITGCKPAGAPAAKQVVVYTSIDQPVAQPILDSFEKQTGIHVLLQTDTEANRSAGLAARLEAERDHPQADVWWGNEVFHTIRLADAAVLAPYESPSAADVPAKFKDPGHRWAGSALRARVIAVHASSDLAVRSLNDLLLPSLKNRIVMASPTAGTTGGHVAALYVLWGEAKFDAFFRGLHDNGVKVVGGNSIVAEQVGSNAMLAGLTDNDDVDATLREGGKLQAVLPDQDGIGTLAIPCTVALVAGAKHPDEAKQLVDYLLSRDVENQLLAAKFAGYSVRAGDRGATSIRTMDVSFDDVAKSLPGAVRRAEAILQNR